MKFHFLNLCVAIGAALAALVGYGFWYAAIASESADVAGLQSQIDAKSENISSIVSARAAVAEISGDEASMQNYFIPETGVVAFIDGLEAQGRSQGATASVLSVSTGAKNTQSTLLLSLTIKGTFDAVMRTVGAIEYAPYDLSVSGLSLAQSDKNSWQADLKLTVGSVNTATSTASTL